MKRGKKKEKFSKAIEIKKNNLTLTNKNLKTALTKGQKIRKTFKIGIFGKPGNLKAFYAMDGAPVLSLEIAQNKAFSAAAYNRATHEWYDRLKDDPPLLHGIVHTPRLVIFGGGYPIKINNELIGGIGVSGGHYTHDMQVCEAALEVLKNLE